MGETVQSDTVKAALQMMIGARGGKTDKRNEERIQRRRLRRQASKTAEACGKCGRELAPGEPVWRVLVSYKCWMGWGHSLVPFCKSCEADRSRWQRVGFQASEPCEYCGRDVHNRWTNRQLKSKHTFCCDRCEWRHYNELAKERRAEAREGLRCGACGEPFEAARSDAKYCSDACRQKAYRERKAKES